MSLAETARMGRPGLACAVAAGIWQPWDEDRFWLWVDAGDARLTDPFSFAVLADWWSPASSGGWIFAPGHPNAGNEVMS